MKQLLFLLLVLILSGGLLPGCSKDKEHSNTSGEKHKLGIAAHSDFNNDLVTIYIDGKSIFNQKITTNNVLSYAASTTDSVFAGQHLIKVVVNGIVSKKQTFTISNDLYIGINYTPQESQISFLLQNHPFAYD